jgi:hypothetical protein
VTAGRMLLLGSRSRCDGSPLIIACINTHPETDALD